MPTDPNRRPSLLSRLVRRILLALYRWKGWTLEGRRPDCDKFIILGAPHTSNEGYAIAKRNIDVLNRCVPTHTSRSSASSYCALPTCWDACARIQKHLCSARRDGTSS